MCGFIEWLWIASAVFAGGLMAGVGYFLASWISSILVTRWADKKMKKAIAEFDASEEDIII